MEQIKQDVMDFIRFNGPSLPAHVGKKINKNLILTGALLSDLSSEKLIKISSAKIGGSPVYYLSGQEPKLELLYQYLPGREKEAFNLLKEKKVIKDREVGAPIRVALRNLKDFAIPFQYSNDIYWRWYSLPKEQLEQYLPKPIEIKQEIKIPEVKVQEKLLVKIKPKKQPKSQFLDSVKQYLTNNKLNIVEEILSKKRNEADIVINVSSDIGKLEFLVCARDKKRISEADLSLAYNKGQKMKLPVIILSPGSLSKKSEKYLKENLRGYVTFKTMS